MLKVIFEKPRGTDFKILCLGAHSDDIEIGCGGTVLKLLEQIPDAEIWWVVLGAAGKRKFEAAESADLFLINARRRNVVLKEFRDGFFPYIGAEIKLFFEEIKRQYSPDLILTHYRQDLHQDHRVVSDLTWNTFRDHMILEYEIPKYDGDIGTPNYFVQLNKTFCNRKIKNLMACFGSQRDKKWFAEDTFVSLMRLRGMESNTPEKYAEAFYCRKIIY